MYQGRLEPSSCQRPRHAWIGSDGIRASGPLLGAAEAGHEAADDPGGGTLVFLAPGT